jgi:hypothetical protein
MNARPSPLDQIVGDRLGVRAVGTCIGPESDVVRHGPESYNGTPARTAIGRSGRLCESDKRW